MKKLFFILLISFSQFSFGQNLIPNPSFEIYDTCPDNEGQITRCIGWSSFGNSPDYFNVCGIVNVTNVPYTGAGYQYAATGNAFCGFESYNINTSIYANREYLGRSLSFPLTINQKYYVSLKVNRPNFANGTYYGICSNKIGVRFTTVLNTASMPIVPNNFAQVYTDSIITDTLNWVLIKGSFIADSAYTYIVIGNFFDNTHTDTLHLGGMNLEAAYFVDDICVSTDSLLCFEPIGIPVIADNPLVSIFPNPVIDDLNIEMKTGSVWNIFIYSCMGQIIYTSCMNIQNAVIDFKKYAAGIYLIVVNQNNKTFSQKIIKF